MQVENRRFFPKNVKKNYSFRNLLQICRKSIQIEINLQRKTDKISKILQRRDEISENYRKSKEDAIKLFRFVNNLLKSTENLVAKNQQTVFDHL